MARQRKPTTQDLLRLDAIAKHLKVKSRYPAPTFTADVTAACLSRIAPIVDKMLPCTGEKIALGLGEHLCLTFEEVHDEDDVADIEARYLKRKKEIGFAQLRGELRQPGVDALLFERMHAEPQESDRWVAVLNLQNSAARAYWNRFHELSHRIAEPPQGILPFKRHQFEASNPVEALVDSVAAEFAFYGPAFLPGRLAGGEVPEEERVGVDLDVLGLGDPGIRENTAQPLDLDQSAGVIVIAATPPPRSHLRDRLADVFFGELDPGRVELRQVVLHGFFSSLRRRFPSRSNCRTQRAKAGSTGLPSFIRAAANAIEMTSDPSAFNPARVTARS